jgi:uncharacterized protein involved in exopolysaccharide biosynthesis
LQATEQDLSEAITQAERGAHLLTRLEENLIVAREGFEGFSKRYASVGSNRGLALLHAPERIKVIDPPRDPEGATLSVPLFLFSAVFAGLLLGIALMITAEFLDDTIRERTEFAKLMGAPIIAVLPNVSVRRWSAGTE